MNRMLCLTLMTHTFLVSAAAQKCRVQSIPGRRPSAGGSDAVPVRAGDVLEFFTELLAAH